MVDLTPSTVTPSTEGDQLVVAAVAAAQPQEAVGQDAAFEKGFNRNNANGSS